MPKKPKLNPPLPEEGPRENVANAAATLHALNEAPHLFSREDVLEMVQACIVRLDTALVQLKPFKWTGSGFVR